MPGLVRRRTLAFFPFGGGRLERPSTDSGYPLGLHILVGEHIQFSVGDVPRVWRYVGRKSFARGERAKSAKLWCVSLGIQLKKRPVVSIGELPGGLTPIVGKLYVFADKNVQEDWVDGIGEGTLEASTSNWAKR